MTHETQKANTEINDAIATEELIIVSIQSFSVPFTIATKMRIKIVRKDPKVISF